VKINGGGSIKPVAPTGVQDVTPGKASGPQAGPAPARDTVEINSVSAQLAQLEKVLSEMGVVDSARVESIKQAISGWRPCASIWSIRRSDCPHAVSGRRAQRVRLGPAG
jgi:flagellar biosynthesis anti-sigma factor FlgM